MKLLKKSAVIMLALALVLGLATVPVLGAPPALTLVSPGAPQLQSGGPNLLWVGATSTTSTVSSVQVQFVQGGRTAAVLDELGLPVAAEPPPGPGGTIPAPIHPNPVADTTLLPIGFPPGSLAELVIEGIVAGVTGSEWIIGSQGIRVYPFADTRVDDVPAVGMNVRILAWRTLEAGPIVASRISQISGAGSQPAQVATLLQIDGFLHELLEWPPVPAAGAWVNMQFKETIPGGSVTNVWEAVITPAGVNSLDNGILFTRATDAASETSELQLVIRLLAELPPDAPSNLAAAEVNPNRVDLTWRDNSSEIRFRIERALDNSFASVTAFEVGTNVTAFSDNTVAPDTEYWYRVVAIKMLGPYETETAPSDARNARVPAPTAPPVAPGSLSATPVSPTQVNLTWQDNSDEEEGFRVMRSSDNVTFNQVGLALPPGTTAFSDDSLTPGATVFYKVIAFNAIGTAESEVATATTRRPPAAPSALTLVSATANMVGLSWTDNADNETGLRVQRSTDNTTFEQVGGDLLAGVVTFTDSTVTASTTYFYRVVAFNDDGTSGFSDVLQVSTPAPPVFTGGGGFAPPPPPPTTTVTVSGLSAPAGSAGLTVNASGVAQAAVELKTADEVTALSIPKDAKLTDKDGKALATLTAVKAASPPAPPPASAIVLAYDFGPDGAKFEPAITIKLKFDPSTLPAGVKPEQLTISYWDGAKWVSVAGKVDAATNTISADVTHFTTFAVVAQLPPKVTITAPAEGTKLPPGNVTVTVDVADFQLVPPGAQAVAGQGHIHYYKDVEIPTTSPTTTAAGTYKATPGTSVVWENVTPGTHTFGVQLVNVNHTPLEPPVTAKVTVTVLPPPRATITAPAEGAKLPPGNVTVTVDVADFQLVPPGAQAVAGQGHIHYYKDVEIPTTPPTTTAAGTYKATPGTSVVWENVTPGTHTFGVQLVNVNHSPLGPPVTATVTVTVLPPPPTVKIVSPAAGAELQPGDVTVTVDVADFQLVPPGTQAVAGQGHIHYYKDVEIPTTPPTSTAAGTYKATPGTSVVWENVTPGTHTFGVQLVNVNHTPFEPPVTATVTVSVVAPPPSPTPTPTLSTPAPSPTPTPTPTTPAPSPTPTPIPTPTPVPTPTPAPAPAPAAPAAGPNWVLISGLIVAAVLVIGLAVFLVRRRATG